MLWGLNACMLGIMFLLHPQRSRSATATHTTLGSSLCLGGLLLMLEKLEGIKPDWRADSPCVWAGGLHVLVV